MRRFTKVLMVLCCLGMLGLFGAFVAMQDNYTAPTIEPASGGAQVATGYTSLEHLMAEIAKLPAPDSAEALPPAPGACMNVSHALYEAREDSEWSLCQSQFGCFSPFAQSAIDNYTGTSEGESEACYTCAQGAQAKAENTARNSWQSCIGEPNTYCSSSNPWC